MNRTILKLIACLSMLLDHIGRAFSIIGPAGVILCDVCGRLAFPLFGYLLAEGFFYTKDRRRYLLRLLALALVSEPLFDLALFRKLPCWSAQNTVFTLTLGLLLFCLLDRVRRLPELGRVPSFILQAVLLAAFAAAAQLLRLDYGAAGIGMLAGFFYALQLLGLVPANRGGTAEKGPQTDPAAPAPAEGRQTAAGADGRRRVYSAFWGIVLVNLPFFDLPGAFLALVPLFFYNGKGKSSLPWKLFFYLFYPLHLLLLVLLR